MWGIVFMTDKQSRVCKNCQHPLQQIPGRNIEPYVILEYYCPDCEESEYRYETLT